MVYSGFTFGAEKDFVAMSASLSKMNQLFRRGNIRAIAFDSTAARASKFSSQSIALAEQMAAFINDLMGEMAAELGVVDVGTSPADIRKYPILEKYFAEAARHRDRLERSEHGLATEQLAAVSTLGESYCGTYWNPRLSSAVRPVTHSRSDPAATLTSWGYHRTPDFAGGGWTRPQTYLWWICGFNTFRDHAFNLSVTKICGTR
jgi:hypothetical protein